MVRHSNPGRIKMFLSSPARPDRLWAPKSPLLNEYGCFFPGIKRPRHDFHHTSPSSTEVKNEWIIHLLPLYAFMAWTRKTFTFYQTEMSGKFHCFGRSAAGSQRISRWLEHSRTACSFLNLHKRTRYIMFWTGDNSAELRTAKVATETQGRQLFCARSPNKLVRSIETENSISGFSVTREVMVAD
jgi:hypothetical protein